jgi:hypothetical protein
MKGLFEEVRLDASGNLVPRHFNSSRGALSRTRSPKTAYRAAVTPTEAFRSTIEAIAQSYPSNKSLQLLVDVAVDLRLPEKVSKELERWVKEHSQRAKSTVP